MTSYTSSLSSRADTGWDLRDPFPETSDTLSRRSSFSVLSGDSQGYWNDDASITSSSYFPEGPVSPLSSHSREGDSYFYPSISSTTYEASQSPYGSQISLAYETSDGPQQHDTSPQPSMYRDETTLSRTSCTSYPGQTYDPAHQYQPECPPSQFTIFDQVLDRDGDWRGRKKHWDPRSVYGTLPETDIGTGSQISLAPSAVSTGSTVRSFVSSIFSRKDRQEEDSDDDEDCTSLSSRFRDLTSSRRSSSVGSSASRKGWRETVKGGLSFKPW